MIADGIPLLFILSVDSMYVTQAYQVNMYKKIITVVDKDHEQCAWVTKDAEGKLTTYRLKITASRQKQ